MSQNVEVLPGAPKVGAANPFPGLRPFKIEESHLFFGREGQSDEVLLKLSKNRFVGVIGPSGSGKSSFIYCGVLPILYGGFLTDASPNWEVIVTRPGGGPIDNLAESLLNSSREYNASDTEDKKIKRTIVSTLLRSSSLGLVEAIEQSRKSEDVNYLVLVDQFEELFRFKDSTDPNSVNETLGFVNLLMEAVNYADAPIYVAITMRSDFIGDCAQFPELTRKINDSHYLIPQMTREQKRRAIEGPVAVGGAKITPRLTQQLLNDLGDNPDQLPILQHALMRTWSYWARYRDMEEELVDLKHYEAIGTMTEALSMHANEAFDELEEDQKRICEILFKAITEKRGENFGIRRPTRLQEIAAIADVSEDDVIAIIEKFREPGRSLLTPGYGLPITSKSMVDISHESLMRIWVRLKNWVDDEADAVQMYLRLAEAASQYQVGKSGLWRPPDLQLALNWQAKHKPTLVWGQRYHPAFERTLIFLEYSKKEFETEQRIKELEQKRKLQRARITALVLASATVISLLFLVYAFYQQTVAKKAAAEAIFQAAEAAKQRDAAQAATLLAQAETKRADEQAKIALQNEAKAQENEKAAIAARLDAEDKKVLAENAEARALSQQKIAEEQKRIADREALAARAAEKESNRLLYISIAKAMALKSAELNDKQQRSIIAQQAYNFNTNNAGYLYDNDIYNGLIGALEDNADPLTASLAGHSFGAARALETRRNSNHLYSGGSEGKIIRWTYEGKAWTPEAVVDVPTGIREYQVYTMDISPDETTLAAGGLFAADPLNNYVELYDLRNMGSPAKKIAGFVYDVENIHFTPDGKGFFARDNAGHSIRYSDLNTATEVIASKDDKINSMDLSPDGSKLAGVSKAGKLYVWDIRNAYAPSVYDISTPQKIKELTAVSFSPDGQSIVVGSIHGEVKLVRAGVVVRELSGHVGAIEQIKYNHAGSFMATASKDFKIRLWNMKDLNKQPIVLSDHDWVWSVAFTPDDGQLMAGVHSVKEEIDEGAAKTKHTIRTWPTKIEAMSGMLCKDYIRRNMTLEEWTVFVGDPKGLPPEKTCANYPLNIKIN